MASSTTTSAPIIYCSGCSSGSISPVDGGSHRHGVLTFTERARQIVVLAQEEARGFEHNSIGTEHLLLGLLRVEEGLAARALGSHEVTIDKVPPEPNQSSPDPTGD